MKIQLNCGACFVKQAIIAMRTHKIESDKQLRILETLVTSLPEFLDQPTPSHYHSIFLQKLSTSLQIPDIYLEDKRRHNDLALNLLPFAQEQIIRSDNPLQTAALLAVEGNLLDQLFPNSTDLRLQISNIIHKNFAINHFDAFAARLGEVNKIMYILDNAGEIGFDRLFIEQCQTWRITKGLDPIEFTSVVKGGPVLNDALEEDAVALGLDRVSTVINSGSNYLGIPIEFINEETKKLLLTADLIISKGQANFETMNENKEFQGRIFFLLKAKCLHIAQFFDVTEGSSIFYFPN